ncbi:MAG: GGDEF domain-containing protein [Longimicrobiales bacterium]|nr:GGDEF domain-containing protein [Longimicrobiales bacterium]
MTQQNTLVMGTSNPQHPDGEGRHASLVVLQGAEIGRHFRLRRQPAVIGRSNDADIRLPDDRASRRHARIDDMWSRASPDATFVLTDLDSTNRTFVNGSPVDRVRLRDGDKIHIGDSILKYVVLDTIEIRFHEEIRHLISYDQLTGLLTKESLFLAFERELERCLQWGLPVSTLMMDLDYLKTVNDTHGHLMGSHVIAEVGKIIGEVLRSVDVSARYGGEEFVSYLAETDPDGARVVADRIRRAVEARPFVLDDRRAEVTISIGISTAPKHGETVKELVAHADEALYRAKDEGRNRVCVASA